MFNLFQTKAKSTDIKRIAESLANVITKDDILLFGRESAGVPNNLHETIKDKIKIPMNKKTRSLNVAMSVAIISAEALRQNNLLK